MNQLTFQSGSFAGETIRTTSDGYASIYDVMRVAGVGRTSTLAWDELKLRFFQFENTSDTSNSRPLVKSFKFPGRGQRDTPVVSGQGLVRLLFLLPGKRARQFVAESAEVLVRHIGGDESLVEEIRRNREIGQTDPQSAQAFMAANIPDEASSALSFETTRLEIEERRARLLRYEKETTRLDEENKALKLQVLEQYRQYAINNIQDPRVKEQIYNEMNNQILSCFNPNTTSQIVDGDQRLLSNSAVVTIDQVAIERMGLRLSTNQKCRLGHAVAAKYRKLHPSTTIDTVEKYVNGEMRPVKAYPRDFEDDIVACISSAL